MWSWWVLWVAVFSIDEFHRSLGMPVELLPQPEPGEPSGYRPAVLSDDTGFVPMIPADGAVGNESDLWSPDFCANVLRALTLVPDAMRECGVIWRMCSICPLPVCRISSKMRQGLLTACRWSWWRAGVSSVNECFY